MCFFVKWCVPQIIPKCRHLCYDAVEDHDKRTFSLNTGKSLTEEWHWCQSYANSESCIGEISKADAVKHIEARKNEVLRYTERATQSEERYLFELLAELMDDDGATATFDDFLGFLG